MFTAETGQSEKADAATSIAETIRVMAWASSIISAGRKTRYLHSSVDKGDIDNKGVRSATVCRVNGDLHIKCLDKNNMSQSCDAMLRQGDTTL